MSAKTGAARKARQAKSAADRRKQRSGSYHGERR